MHGVVFIELRKFVESNFPGRTWHTILGSAGLTDIYLPSKTYPDSELNKIVLSASSLLGVEASKVLEDFGEFIVPDLVSIYGAFIPQDWSALDLIENIESTIHRVVRMKNPGATPAQLVCRRLGEKDVTVIYTSHRKLCAFAMGILRGIGKAYSVDLRITERQCMHKGHDQCVFDVHLTKPDQLPFKDNRANLSREVIPS